MMFTVRKIDSINVFLLDMFLHILFVCFVFTYGSHGQLILSLSSYIFKALECKQCWKVGLCCFWFFFWTLAFVVCLSLFSFTLYCLSLCSQPCPHGLQHPSSKTFQKKAERSQDALILLLSLPWPFRTRVSSGTGAWTVGSWLSTVERSSGDALSWCNTKKFFKVLISLSFKLVYKARSNWNWSTVELTEKQTNWKKT